MSYNQYAVLFWMFLKGALNMIRYWLDVLEKLLTASAS